MIGFYAIGGGFGHLTRIKAFIQTKNISPPFKIITTNTNVHRFFRTDQIAFVHPDTAITREVLAQRLEAIINDHMFQELYIDTFPQGIMGELASNLLSGIRVNYLARRMIWKRYEHLLNSKVAFHQSFIFESLEDEHYRFIKSCSKELIPSSLVYPPSEPTKAALNISQVRQPIWLIVHTTHQEEVEILIQHARDLAQLEGQSPQMVVLTDVQINSDKDLLILNNEDPRDWYAGSQRIFSAGGFNTWHQLKDYRHRHICVPFKRKFDDQFWRVSSTP